MNRNQTTTQNDISKLILRVSLGVILLAHGSLKLFVFTPAGTVGFFESLGLPAIFAYLTILGELGLGTTLILGLVTRISAVLSLPIMLGATWVHAGNGWLFSNQGGGWEFPALLAILSMVVALQGSDRFALANKLPINSPILQ